MAKEYYDPLSRKYKPTKKFVMDLLSDKDFRKLDPVEQFRVAVAHGLCPDQHPMMFHYLKEESRKYQMNQNIISSGPSPNKTYDFGMPDMYGIYPRQSGKTVKTNASNASKQAPKELDPEEIKKLVEEFRKNSNLMPEQFFGTVDKLTLETAFKPRCFHEVMITPPVGDRPSMYVCIRCGEEVRVGEELKKKNMKWAEGYGPLEKKEEKE